MMISPGVFFIFDIFIFWAVRGVKGQKIAQDDKKILSIAFQEFQEPYIMILINDLDMILTLVNGTRV